MILLIKIDLNLNTLTIIDENLSLSGTFLTAPYNKKTSRPNEFLTLFEFKIIYKLL